MRLLIDARPIVDAPHGGVGRVAHELIRAYAQAFPDDELVCATTGVVKTALPNDLAAFANIKRVHLNIPNKVWSLGCMTGLMSLDRSIQRISGPCDAAFFPNIGFFGRPSLPHAILLHDLSFLIEPNWFTTKQRLWHQAVQASSSIKRATHLFAVSNKTARDAHDLLGIPPERITVLPFGPTLDVRSDRSATLPFSLPTRFVLALGAGDRRKNAATAIDAVRSLRLSDDHRDLELVLVGRTESEPKETWIHAVQDLSDETLSHLYDRAAIFIYPSWYEGYGLPLHEAAAHGTPRIASITGALPETAPMGTLFADPAKPQQWAEAVKLALKQPRTVMSQDPNGWKEAAHKIKLSF